MSTLRTIKLSPEAAPAEGHDKLILLRSHEDNASQ
jgi:hypothetical protein